MAEKWTEFFGVLGSVSVLPLAFLVALAFGGFVPVAVWCLITGSALFSSLTVIDRGRRILLNTPKAIGFAVLVEGVMITSQTEWLALSSLGLLIIVNSVACAVALARDTANG